ncbi:unnamed protein product [Cladocopium goreaui]|uniref:Serine/threonine-protein kinase ppk5 n=1 Tax=Cladocopium goreaui TaxID=2562237 RepID=A0A9P1CGY1_9DINO|nr:unnamed protein product [Cladocopium goreaui]
MSGTGFVAPADLPLSDEEDVEQVQSAPAQASSQRHVGFGQDVKEPSPSQSHRASRKGTGFVSPDDLPHSDEEDDEAQPATSSRHVGFDKDAQEASPSQKRHSASRKGTGFVAPADLPLSDEEDVEQVQSAPAQASSQRHVGFGQDVKEPSPSQSHRASRKGRDFGALWDWNHEVNEGIFGTRCTCLVNLSATSSRMFNQSPAHTAELGSNMFPDSAWQARASYLQMTCRIQMRKTMRRASSCRFFLVLFG